MRASLIGGIAALLLGVGPTLAAEEVELPDRHWSFGGMFGTFLEPTVRDITLYTAGFPASYGGRLSSVLDVSSAAEARQAELADLKTDMRKAYGTPVLMKIDGKDQSLTTASNRHRCGWLGAASPPQIVNDRIDVLTAQITSTAPA